MKAFKFSVNVDKESFRKVNLVPFFAGIMVVIFMKFLSLTGYQPSMLMSPMPKKVELFDSVKPKLESKVNEFQLNKPLNIIGEVQAAGKYDDASAYAVVDLDTGEILAEKSLDTKLPIASITKVMTAIVTLDLADQNEMFTITKNAASRIPTKIGVVPGQKMSVIELLHASLLTSANDATEALKDGIDAKYGEEVFIRAMNEKAQFIGLKNTHFANAQGFDNAENYSTAGDLAILAHYAQTHYPVLSEIVKKDYTFLAADENHKQFDLYNWNGLLGVYPNVTGIKIGNTREAGVTTMVVSEREGKKIAVILLGTPGVLERDLWASQLFDIGFEKSLGLKPVNITEEQLRKKYKEWKYFN